MIGNIKDFSFVIDGVTYGYFNGRRYKNPLTRDFLIRSGAIEPIGRPDKNMPDGELKSKILRARIGAFNRGARFIYKLDLERIDKISAWLESGDAPELAGRLDPIDQRKLVLVPRDKALHNLSYFPWYTGW